MATGVLGTGFLARNLDRRTARPAGIVYWLDDAPPALSAAGSVAVVAERRLPAKRDRSLHLHLR